MPDRDARAWAAAQHPALGGDGPLLLLPGRGTRLKGHADALALLARAARRRHRCAAVAAGRARSRARRLHRRTRSARPPRSASPMRSRSPPPTDAIAAAYAASDLVLQLSRKPESFGRTVIEALSVGRPVLGWAHGGVGELLDAAAAAGRGARRSTPTRCTQPRATLLDPSAATPSGYASAATPCSAMQDATLAVYAELSMTPNRSRRLTPHAPTGWRWAPAWVLAFVALWPAPGYRRRRDGARRAGGDRQAAARAFPRRRAAAQRTGVGADQRAVLRLLGAGTGVGVRCGRPPARALREAAVDLRYLPFLWLVAIGGRRRRAAAASPSAAWR